MQYECENNGSTVYHGRTVRYYKGAREYEPGSLDHVPSCKMIEASNNKGVTTIEPKPLDGTVKEIKAWLDDHGVDYKSNLLKDELIEILEDA